MYLALVLDVYSRKIVGYDFGTSLEASGSLRALRMALRQMPEGAQPIHHSDRGCQYCSHMYINLLNKNEVKISMTELNHCYENAMAERLNGILKHEYWLNCRFNDEKEARLAVSQAIESYNDYRPHLSLNYGIPNHVHKTAA